MTTPAYSYGLHTDEDGVTFLHQGNESMNFIGLGRPSPFKVQAGNTPCPHRFELVGEDPSPMQKVCMRRMISHPVLRHLCPGLGTPGFYYIEAEGHDLGRLGSADASVLEVSNPTVPLLHAMFNVSKRKLLDWYRVTNCAPLVISHVTLVIPTCWLK